MVWGKRLFFLKNPTSSTIMELFFNKADTTSNRTFLDGCHKKHQTLLLSVTVGAWTLGNIAQIIISNVSTGYNKNWTSNHSKNTLTKGFFWSFQNSVVYERKNPNVICIWINFQKHRLCCIIILLTLNDWITLPGRWQFLQNCKKYLSLANRI